MNPHPPQHRNQSRAAEPASASVLWRAARFTLRFPGPAVIMGIVNVTPDSFSDGGQFASTQAAVDYALRLIEQGAGILDVGGESTRPGAEPVPEEEELRRVLPVIESLANRVEVPLSIDTLKPGVAQVALAAGASIVNDVGANRSHPVAMRDLIAQTGAGYICMHMQGSPRTMQEQPTYRDVATEVGDYFQHQLEGLVQAGVAPEQVVLDVGLGFGKTVDHNLQLLAALDRTRRLGRPMLVGASRKSFIGKLLGGGTSQRLPGSLACACWAVQPGAQIIRVHDVPETWQALRLTEAIAHHLPSWSGNS